MYNLTLGLLMNWNQNSGLLTPKAQFTLTKFFPGNSILWWILLLSTSSLNQSLFFLPCSNGDNITWWWRAKISGSSKPGLKPSALSLPSHWPWTSADKFIPVCQVLCCFKNEGPESWQPPPSQINEVSYLLNSISLSSFICKIMDNNHSYAS